MRKRAILTFQKFTEAEKLEFAQNVVESMSSHDMFEPLEGDVNVLKNNVSSWQIAIAEAKLGDKVKMHEKKEKCQTVMSDLVRLAGEVTTLTHGKEADIWLSGFDTRKPAEKINHLLAPEIKAATQGNQSGTIKIVIGKVRGARSYAFEHSVDQGKTWHNGKYTTRTRTIIGGFEPGTQVLVRCRAIGSNELLSDWSQEVTVWTI